MNLMIKKSRAEECLSDLVLDRRLLGELSDEEEQHTRRHLFECTACTGRLESLRADREVFAGSAPQLAELLRGATAAPALPQLRLVGGTQADTAARDRGALVRWLQRSRSWLAVAAIAASIGAIALVARPFAEPQGVRLKGEGVQFGVFIKHGDVVREGSSGDVVHPGDVLRFSYASEEARHVGVLSLDGARRASIYFPAGKVSTQLPASTKTALPDGILLDGALGREDIYGLFCDRPVELEPLRARLETEGSLGETPAGCAVERLVLEKKVK